MKLWDREGRRRFGTSTVAQCVKKMRKDATDVRASLLFLAIVGNSFHNLQSLSFAQLHAGRRRRSWSTTSYVQQCTQVREVFCSESLSENHLAGNQQASSLGTSHFGVLFHATVAVICLLLLQLLRIPFAGSLFVFRSIRPILLLLSLLQVFFLVLFCCTGRKCPWWCLLFFSLCLIKSERLKSRKHAHLTSSFSNCLPFVLLSHVLSVTTQRGDVSFFLSFFLSVLKISLCLMFLFCISLVQSFVSFFRPWSFSTDFKLRLRLTFALVFTD